MNVKDWFFERTLAELRGFDIAVVEEQSSRNKPWGAYVRISDQSLPQFYAAYWSGIRVPQPAPNLKLDPKILIIEPGQRLSLQYHHRRSEHWRVLDGPVNVVCGHGSDSLSDNILQPGEVLHLPCGHWHRLVGLETWGRVAEIWEHTHSDSPSDEEDIVRVEDDYGR